MDFSKDAWTHLHNSNSGLWRKFVYNSKHFRNVDKKLISANLNLWRKYLHQYVVLRRTVNIVSYDGNDFFGFTINGKKKFKKRKQQCFWPETLQIDDLFRLLSVSGVEWLLLFVCRSLEASSSRCCHVRIRHHNRKHGGVCAGEADR